MMAAIKYWVWLSSLQIRPQVKQLLLARFNENPMDLYYAAQDQLLSVDGVTAADINCMGRRELDGAMEILARCEEENISVLTFQDAAYPQRLRNIYDPPVVLYVKGNLPVMDEEPAIAIVGTRDATPYGTKMARRMGYEITKCGGLVVSGLTRGIDRLGASGALQAGGRVVGVLGTSIEEARGGIFDDVAHVGALISEYPPGSASRRTNFRYRNRITAGLSEGVVVVEAPEKSGALLFADEALEQGKEIFAVPGNADAPNSVGTNRLIQDGAKAVSGGWDVMVEFETLYRYKIYPPGQKVLQFRRKLSEVHENFKKLREVSSKKVIDKEKPEEYIDWEKQREKLSGTQLAIIEQLSSSSLHIDELIEATGFDAQTVLSELTMLEIEGIVSQEPGKRFTLNNARG